MWASESQHEYMAIHTDSNNYILCAPFGLDTARSPYITYYGYTEVNRINNRWFHLTCQYSYAKLLNGYIYYGGSETNYYA